LLNGNNITMLVPGGEGPEVSGFPWPTLDSVLSFNSKEMELCFTFLMFRFYKGKFPAKGKCFERCIVCPFF
jgi:hypothetical protein